MPQNSAPHRRHTDSLVNRVLLSLPDVSPPGSRVPAQQPTPDLMGTKMPLDGVATPVIGSDTHPPQKQAVEKPTAEISDPLATASVASSNGSDVPSTAPLSGSNADALAGNTMTGDHAEEDAASEVTLAPAKMSPWIPIQVKSALMAVAAVVAIWVVLGALRGKPGQPTLANAPATPALPAPAPNAEATANSTAPSVEIAAGTDSTKASEVPSEPSGESSAGSPVASTMEPPTQSLPELTAMSAPTTEPTASAAANGVANAGMPELAPPSQPAVENSSAPGQFAANPPNQVAGGMAPNATAGLAVDQSAAVGQYPQTNPQTFIYPPQYPFLQLAPAQGGNALPPAGPTANYPSASNAPATQLQGEIGRAPGINR